MRKWHHPFNGEQFPDSKVHGANMGPIWDRQDPGGPHVGPMNLPIWVVLETIEIYEVENIIYLHASGIRTHEPFIHKSLSN